MSRAPRHYGPVLNGPLAGQWKANIEPVMRLGNVDGLWTAKSKSKQVVYVAHEVRIGRAVGYVWMLYGGDDHAALASLFSGFKA